MILDSINGLLKAVLLQRRPTVRSNAQPSLPILKPICLNDFLELDVPPREMLLNSILPERSLAMLYAPRGVGKTMLSLSIGLAVASGSGLLPTQVAFRHQHRERALAEVQRTCPSKMQRCPCRRACQL